MQTNSRTDAAITDLINSPERSYTDIRYNQRPQRSLNALSRCSAAGNGCDASFCAGAGDSGPRSRSPAETRVSCSYGFLTETNTPATAFRCLHGQRQFANGRGLRILDNRTGTARARI